MLRITIQHEPEFLTVRLEGRLAGPWVTELRDCWQSGYASLPPAVHIDLKSVTFVDAGGKELLREMHRQGARLIANDCQMKAIVAEIESNESANP